MAERRNLFVPGKTEYVKAKRSRAAGECILCDIARGADTVVNLQVARDNGFVVSLNLYPYNPGHVMIFPARHVEDPRELSPDELGHLARLQNLALDVLAAEYQAGGFNVGFNLGEAAGASLPHLHLHVVPRYKRELGVLDVLSGTKIIIEDPHETQRRLRAAFEHALQKSRG
ncbi:MAG: HIT domain-containing protein [Candidatus Coatesbacteria bacterium]|nr:MAG: HIT domain-containing protein [Candidatus Coatesbacteria bacterium]